MASVRTRLGRLRDLVALLIAHTATTFGVLLLVTWIWHRALAISLVGTGALPIALISLMIGVASGLVYVLSPPPTCHGGN